MRGSKSIFKINRMRRSEHIGVFYFSTNNNPSDFSLQLQYNKMKSLMKPNHSKVALVGGTNLTGVVLASFLARLNAILPDHIKIFDRNTKFNLEQYLPHFAFGVRDREDVEHYILKTLTQYHRFNFDELLSLDPIKHELRTLDSTYSYDFLILCNDPEPNFSLIPGLREALDDPRNGVCSFFNADSTEKVRNLLLSGAGEGKVAFYDPGTSSRNQLAMVNAALLFKQKYGKKARELHYITESKTVFEPSLASKNECPSGYLKSLLESEGFTIRTSTKLAGIDQINSLATLKTADKTENFSYDLLLVDPPFQIAETLKKTPLYNEKLGSLEFNPKTLRHLKFRNVFAASRNVLMLEDRLPQSLYSCSVDSSEICRGIIEEMHSKFEGGLSEEEPLKVYSKYPIFYEKGKVKHLEYTLDGEWKLIDSGRLGYWTEMIFNPWLFSHFIPKGRLILPKEYISPNIFRRRF